MTRPLPRSTRRVSPIAEFFAGAALVWRGFRLWGTSPRVMLLGALPALIVFIAYATLLIILSANVGGIADGITPFADTWDDPWRSLIRFVVALSLVGLGALFAVITFSVVTLLVGQPFYERVSHTADSQVGGVANEVDVPFWASFARGFLEGIRMLLLTVAVGAGVFLSGLIPVVGVIGPVLGAITGGCFLALELTTVPFERRGLRLRDRRDALGRQRWASLGFGVATFLLFLVPGAAVVTMPAAVAGATLLARRSLGESITAKARTDTPPRTDTGQRTGN